MLRLDSAVHIAEEIKDSRRALPKTLIYTVLIMFVRDHVCHGSRDLFLYEGLGRNYCKLADY